MAGLLNDCKGEQEQQRRGPGCGVGILLTQMDKEDSEDLERALADETIFGSVISSVLRRRGHDVRAETVQRHRRKMCSCSKDI